jgi:glycosyltransferase involved in cell wall biosynthesis
MIGASIFPSARCPMLPISIVIPCYNAAATLARTLNSCLAQPEAAQIIVIDDGSVDPSPHIVERYAARHPHVELLRMPHNTGPARARNWGALHASQPLIALIDADDEYLPGALAAASRFLTEYPQQASVRLDVDFVGFPAEMTAHPSFEVHAATLSNTVPSGLVIRRQVYMALGGFPLDEYFRLHGGEDGAFSLALRETFGNPRLSDAKRVRMHHHKGIHAERYLRIAFGLQRPDADVLAETARLSMQFTHRAVAAIAQLRELRVESAEIHTALRG